MIRTNRQYTRHRTISNRLLVYIAKPNTLVYHATLLKTPMQMVYYTILNDLVRVKGRVLPTLLRCLNRLVSYTIEGSKKGVEGPFRALHP